MMKHGEKSYRKYGGLKFLTENKPCPMATGFVSEEVNEAVVVVWMPMFRKLLKNEHKCPCYPEEGLCPCKPFIEKLECRCGLFIIKDVYLHGNFEPVRKVRVHG